VGQQGRRRVRRFLEKTEVPYHTLYDDEGVSTRAYGAPATSYIVIVDRAGRVAYTGTGRDQDFLPALRRVAAH
jgi:predicted transcriptional regulator